MSKKKFKLGKAKRVANITFEGTAVDGLEVRCGLDLPLKTVMKIQSLMVSEDDAESVEANMIWCDEVLESWNLTDDEGKERIGVQIFNTGTSSSPNTQDATYKVWGSLITTPGTVGGANWTQIGDDIKQTKERNFKERLDWYLNNETER